MLIKLYLVQFLNDIRHQKLRAFLTLFGLIWGTTAIMLLLAFGEAIERQTIKNMHGMGNKIAILWPGRTSIAYAGFGKGRRISFYREDVEYLKQNIPELNTISGEVRGRGDIKLKYKKKNISLDVIGVEAEWADMRNVIPQMGGRFLHPEDIELKRRVVFIGNKLKENVFGEEDAIGKYVNINGNPFQVIGIMKPKLQPSSYSGRDHSKAIIPITTCMLMFGIKNMNNLVYQPKSAFVSDAVKEQVKEHLSKLKKFDKEDPDAIYIWDTAENDKFIGYFMLGLRLFLGIVGAFTIIVAGIGVANIMNVVVEERTQEIGIKLALGIKRKIIMVQFLFETFLLTFFGGAIGFLISGGICKIAGMFNIEEYVGLPQVTVFVAVSTTIILGIVAFLSGFFPARRASRLNPVEALRW